LSCISAGEGRLPQRRARTLLALAALATMRLQIGRWRERSRTRRLLAAINARDLQDIGLSHSDIANEIGKPFWQP
jgi:uncharacterized protein YjiS (DUF1127 family)